MKAPFLLAFLVLLASPARGQEWFDSAQFFSTDDTAPSAQWRAVADVDLDGDPDVVWVSVGEVKTLLNDLGGPTNRLEFGPPVALSPAWTVGRPVVGDVDGDNLPDLVYGSHVGGWRVVVVFGDGAGGFGNPVTAALTQNFPDIVLGNFDADSSLEIAVARQFAGPSTGLDVSYLDWNGTGFDSSTSIFLRQNNIQMITTDVDDDGTDDVIATVTGALAQILPTVGGAPTIGGTFTVTNVGAGFTLRAADMDGDGDEDLLATSLDLLPMNTNFALAVMEKTGASTYVQVGPDTFALPRRGSTLYALAQPWSYAGDWDGDGDLDVVNQGELAYFFENDGGNRFTLVAQPLVEKDESFRHDGAGLADFDANGSLDYFGPRALVYGDGTFRDSPGPLTGLAVSFPRARDVEGDGDVDLIFRNGSVSFNDGSGGFTNVDAFPEPPAGFEFGSTAEIIDDFDGDGEVDYLVRYLERTGPFLAYRSMYLVRGTPAGFVNSGPATDIGLGDNFLAGSGFREGVDLDGDEDLDLIDAGRVWLNDGSGFFTPVASLPSDGVTHAADVEPDGDVDLLAYDALSGSYDYRLLRNQGNGSLVSEFLTNKPDGGNLARFFDLDGDDDLDLVLPSAFGTGGSSLTVLENTGNSFVVVGELAGGPGNSSSLDFRDIDLDGHRDLISGSTADFTSSAIGNLAVYRHTGSGLEFEPLREYIQRGVYPLMDLEGDGDLDAIGFGARILNRFHEGPSAGSLRQVGDGRPGTGGIAPVLGASGPIIPDSPTAFLHLRRAVGGTIANLQVRGLEHTTGPGKASLSFWLPVSGTAGEPGVGTADLRLPISASLAGLELSVRAFVIDPGANHGFSVSNLLELVIGT